MLTLDQVKSKSAGWLGKLHPVLLDLSLRDSVGDLPDDPAEHGVSARSDHHFSSSRFRIA